MEKMFAGFAADGEAAGDVSAGTEASLNGIADGFVLILNFFADFDASLIFLLGFLTDVGKIVVEDDGAFIDGERDDEIGVHNSFVCVDHEIRVDPEIEGAALARRCNIFFGFGVGIERTGLQAGALEILDGVAGVFDDAAEAFVGMGHVVAAVEIIVDIDFPIAL